MLKIKLLTVFLMLGTIGVVLSTSGHFSTSAKDDPTLKALAGYKEWTRITEKPIRVGPEAAPLG